MFPNNLYIVDQVVRRRQEELVRKAAWNRLAREGEDADGVRASWMKSKLLVVLGVLIMLAWFLS